MNDGNQGKELRQGGGGEPIMGGGTRDVGPVSQPQWYEVLLELHYPALPRGTSPPVSGCVPLSRGS